MKKCLLPMIFVESVMRCVLAVGPSRLITPTTFWHHAGHHESRQGEDHRSPVKVDFPEPGAYAIEYVVTAASPRSR